MNEGFIMEHTGQRSEKKKMKCKRYRQNKLSTRAISRKQCFKFLD